MPTLLQKAMKAPKGTSRARKAITPEQLDLAMAYLDGEITVNQMKSVIEKGTNINEFVKKTLYFGYKQGLVKKA